MSSIQKIAKILRTDKNTIEQLAEKAEKITDRYDVFDRIMEENEALIKNRLQLKALSEGISAEEIYKSLIDKIREDDLQLFKALGKPSFMLKEDVDFVLEKVKDLVVPAEGFFLKKEKAVEFLKKEPPQKVID